MAHPTLLIHHQDGGVEFKITQALYHLSLDGVFSCSVHCDRNQEHQYLSKPRFSAHGVPVKALLPGQTFTVESKFTQGMSPLHPRTHMYAGEHFSPWSAKLEIHSVQAGSVSIIGSFKIEDPNYYDQRAKDTAVEFEASFLSAPVSEIWSPI